MRALLDKRDLGEIEGISRRTLERRIAERTDFPEPVTGSPDTNARVQWFAERCIEWYERHPEVLRHARPVVEFVMKQKPRRRRKSIAA